MKHSISIFWRSKDNHYRVLLTKCDDCGRLSAPKRIRCPYCGSRNVRVSEARGTGELINYTISYYRVEGHEQHLPRIIGLVRLDEGPLIVGEVVDADPAELTIGMRVEAVLRKYSSDDPNGLIYYGLKFMPVIKRTENANTQ
ncbi:MAG: Zn-ribbon domain-containing OB-fold protein [Zestosphaera sp.]